MQKINRHNYETFFIDFIDGNLSENQKKELLFFLENNPDLKKELSDIEKIKLEPDDIIFDKKDELIKNVTSKHFDITEFEYLCVAELEKDINITEKLRLKFEIETNHDKKNEFKLFEHTKLKPENVKYPGKNMLYAEKSIYTYARKISYSAAAIILLFVLIKTDFFRSGNNKVQNPSATAISKSNNKTNKKIYISAIDNPDRKTVEDNKVNKRALFTHNQTINKQANYDVLAFDDNESREINDLYEEKQILIPEIKGGTLISNLPEPKFNAVPVYFSNIENKKEKLTGRDNFWRFTEKGVNIWKKMTGDNIELKNTYAEDGSVEEVNFMASNFQFRKTFRK